MPQVFKIGAYWVYFGSNENIIAKYNVRLSVYCAQPLFAI